MHLGRFGCIATELLSENPYRNPYQISGKKTSTASTGKTKHFLVIFGFFHGTKYVIVSWKNPNFDNCIAKFCCGSGRKFSEFFQNFQKNSSKICKKYKKYLKIPFFLKMRLVKCMVWHIFFPEICFYNFNLKKYFSEIWSIFKKWVGFPWRWRWQSVWPSRWFLKSTNQVGVSQHI